ncbi:MAG: UDP-N-acetylmuramoyl-tripeptide--D-alanyl-D-alanine ligase [Candidatus Desulfofervidaceae bacterium]|nr:UDP-N-acetylmuramoyl-tripeptide--D-alanyl-D-alanine ligase [Candidatus Desulfofervidaceae bacterium]MDL1969630.1 UDP-N-acetylmuramoyl-tripeptide--D-alanyl-D-alanine ligase [Candidatus Desulfofervidaceae bacterium]
MRQTGNWILRDILQGTRGKLVTRELLPMNSELVDCLRIGAITDDTRSLQPNDLFIALKGNRYDGHEFIPLAIEKGASGIILNKGYLASLNLPSKTILITVDDTLHALGNLAHYWRDKHGHIPLIAVTGSCGKTTTKEAISGVLQQGFKVLKNMANYNNQIGLPFTMLGLDSSYDVACVELGTNKPGEIAYLASIARPQIGIITNIQPAHLEGFSTLKNIQTEKGALLPHVQACFIYNADDPMVAELANSFHKSEISFGFNHGEIRAKNIVCEKEGIRFILVLPDTHLEIKSRVLGRHQIYALLAAAAVGHYFELTPDEIKQALETFSPLSGRLCLYQGENGIFILDDCYNANPASMQTALQTLKQFSGEKIAVLGDMLELGEKTTFWHQEVGKWAAKVPLKALIVYGTYADDIKEGALKAGMNGNKIYPIANKEEILSLLKKICVPGDVILFKASHNIGFGKLVAELRGKP